MNSKYNNTIFLDECFSKSNWKALRDYETEIYIDNSSLIISNHSDVRKNSVISKSQVLPENHSINYQIEAKIKIGDDLKDNQLIALKLGSNNMHEFYKFSFNKNSWVEIKSCHKKNFYLLKRLFYLIKEQALYLSQGLTV